MRTGALAMTASIAMGIMAATPASAAPKCFGKAATIVGTSRADRIRGTNGRDVIVGRGGSDLLRGLDGNDLVCVGGGDDLIVGNDGRDQLYGGRCGDGNQPETSN